MIPCAHDPAVSRASAQIYTGLKIPRGKTRAGSIPASGTTKHAPFRVSGHSQNINRRRIVGATVGASGPGVRGFDSLHPLIPSTRKYSVFTLENRRNPSTAGRGMAHKFTRNSHRSFDPTNGLKVRSAGGARWRS